MPSNEASELMQEFSGTQDFYAFIDLLGERLSAAGFGDHARKLRLLVHEVAWTTGSELLGELGLELERIQALHGPDLPREISEAISRSLRFVRRHWPSL